MAIRIAAGSALALAACFNPAVPEGLPCGPAPELACPSGQACGADGRCRGPGGDVDGAGPDATRSDGATDASSPPDAAGGFVLTEISEIADPIAADQDPSMTADALELVWSSTRTGGLGESDLWHSLWDPAVQMWGAPELIENVNSTAFEQSPEIARGGLTMFFVSDRNGNLDVWTTFRVTRDSPWQPPTQVAGLTTPLAEHNLSVHNNSVAVTDREVVALGQRDLYFSVRTAPAAWPAGDPIAEVNTPVNEGSPFITQDDLSLYFHRTSATAPQRIYLATRASTLQPFGNPQQILADGDADPWASDDGDTLLFTRAGEIWMAQR